MSERNQEYERLQRCKPSYIGNIEFDGGNQNVWNVLLLPVWLLRPLLFELFNVGCSFLGTYISIRELEFEFLVSIVN